jgi:uncharacterized Fe-S cluster-containing protein
MANRIEELDYEVSGSNGNRNTINTFYLIGPKTFMENRWKLNEIVEESLLLKKLHQPQAPPSPQLPPAKEYFEAERELRQSQQQQLRFDNIQKILELIVRKFKLGQLPFPPVTEDVLLRAKERLVRGSRSSDNREFGENWSVYFHILNKIKQTVLAHIIGLEAKLLVQNKEFEEVKSYGYGLLLKRAKFVGMTTTGAAKYNSILHMMKNKMGKEQVQSCSNQGCLV